MVSQEERATNTRRTLLALLLLHVALIITAGTALTMRAHNNNPENTVVRILNELTTEAASTAATSGETHFLLFSSNTITLFNDHTIIRTEKLPTETTTNIPEGTQLELTADGRIEPASFAALQRLQPHVETGSTIHPLEFTAAGVASLQRPTLASTAK